MNYIKTRKQVHPHRIVYLIDFKENISILHSLDSNSIAILNTSLPHVIYFTDSFALFL